jgi:NTE family protein
VGYVGGKEKASPEISFPSFQEIEQDLGALRASLAYDTFDDWAFPHSGFHARATALYSREGLGSDADWDRIDLRLDKAFSRGVHRLQLGLAGGSSFGSDLPVFEGFSLGGFLRLSGYGNHQFIGQEYGLARAIYSYAIGQSQLTDSALYVGGSLEAGNVYERLNGPSSTGLRSAGSLWVAAETAVGPAYLAVGAAEGGNYALYIYLGKPY